MASRRVTTTLVGSYPTVSPLPPASPERDVRRWRLLSVPLSVGFRRLGFPQRPALWCPDFPRTAHPARGHPACTKNGSAIAKSEAPNYGAAAPPVVDAGEVSRLAVLGDVHGNPIAFAAVLEEIRADPPDLVVVNGDLSWGHEPEATLAMADALRMRVRPR